MRGKKRESGKRLSPHPYNLTSSSESMTREPCDQGKGFKHNFNCTVLTTFVLHMYVRMEKMSLCKQQKRWIIICYNIKYLSCLLLLFLVWRKSPSSSPPPPFSNFLDTWLGLRGRNFNEMNMAERLAREEEKGGRAAIFFGWVRKGEKKKGLSSHFGCCRETLLRGDFSCPKKGRE